MYHELFDDALKRFNEKQTRDDRRIPDYYEKIVSGKQEKPFYEVIFQIGDKDNMGVGSDMGEMAAHAEIPNGRNGHDPRKNNSLQ